MRACSFCAAVAVLFAGSSATFAEDKKKDAPSSDDYGQMLVKALKSTKGCAGVELAKFESGKIAIFAWFENKAAAARWYYHPVHTRMMGMLGSSPKDKKPLAHVKDNVPVLTIATVTPAAKQKIEGFPMPISQISIELYTPLPGGTSVNGRLTPKGIKVPKMTQESTTKKPSK